MKAKTIFILAILLAYVMATEAQGVLSTDAMIRVAEQKTKLERMAVDGKKRSPAQQAALTLIVKVADENAADTYARLREQGVTIRGRIGQQAIVEVPLNKVETIAQMDGILRVDVGHQGQLKTDVGRQVMGVNLLNGSNPTVPSPFTGKGVTVCVMDIGMDFKHPAFKDAEGRSRIKCVYCMMSDKGRKFVYDDPVAGPIEFPGSVFDTPELIAKLNYDINISPHGGHTTGIAAGSGYDSPYRGMAPEADICLVANAVADDTVYIDSADYYKYTFATDALGFKYLFDYAKSVGKPCVASFSEGSTQDFWGYDQLYYEMLDSLVGPGRILVSAAGNNAYAKSWFRKPQGQPSAGAFLTSGSSEMILTFKSAHDFRLRFVLYNGDSDTLEIQTSDVLLQKDSTLTSALRYEDYQLVVTTEAYPSSYNAHEMCYDVTIQTTYHVGQNRPLSVEVLGVDADVEFFRVNGLLTTSDLNPLLNAGDYTHSILSPSSAPCVISVGATSYRDSIQNRNGEWKKYWFGNGGIRAPFSSIGPTFDGRLKPDVMAPGNNIVSSYSTFYEENHPERADLTWDVARFDFKGRTYAWNSNTGTSMSCPAVAGAIALWLQAKPDLTPQEIKDVLHHTCHHYDESMPWPNQEYGYGEIDVYRGLLYILGIDRIEAVSKHHTSALVRYADNQLCVSFEEPLSSTVRLRLYNMSGRLVHTAALKSGQTSYSLPLSSLPSGIYALQLDGPSAIKGSTLIRK